MSNLSIKINLSKIPGAGVVNLTGKSGAVKKCVYIPIEDADLYVGEKGIYLNTTGLEIKDQKFADTHCIKLSVSKEKYEAMTEQQRKDMPIIGGVQPFKGAEAVVTPDVVQVPEVEGDDLPF